MELQLCVLDKTYAGLESFFCDVCGLSPSGDDGLWVDPHVDELFSLAEELGGEDGDGGGAVTHLFVLNAGHLNNNLSGGVVHTNRPAANLDYT